MPLTQAEAPAGDSPLLAGLFTRAFGPLTTSQLHAGPVRSFMEPGRLVPNQPVFSRAWTRTRPHPLAPPLG